METFPAKPNSSGSKGKEAVLRTTGAPCSTYPGRKPAGRQVGTAGKSGDGAAGVQAQGKPCMG